MNKNLIIIVVLGVVAACSAIFLVFNYTQPTGNVSENDGSSSNFGNTQYSLLKNEVEWSGKDMVFDQLLSKGRYRVKFSSDKPVKMILADEQNYQKYLQGRDGMWKATSQANPSECCSTYGSYVFDINENEAGKYYLILIDKLGTNPTRASYEIDKIKDI